MDQDKWGEILDRVQAQFEVLEHSQTPGAENIGEVETLIFVGPMGKIKLLWITHPVVLDRKVIGAHRRGASSGKYEYVYSDTEKSHKLEAFREVDGEWQELDSNAFTDV